MFVEFAGDLLGEQDVGLVADHDGVGGRVEHGDVGAGDGDRFELLDLGGPGLAG